MIRSRTCRTLAAILLASPAPPLLVAQVPQSKGPEPATALVAVLTAVLYNDQANAREVSDSAQATLATEVLRARLRERLGDQALPYQVIDSLSASPQALEVAGGVPCQVRVACALSVASRAGARWVVMTKISKTSNLIWLLSAQLIRVSTGEIVLDDSTELKGEPGPMVRVGTRIFADRVARTVQAGGYATNYPQGEPTY